jgi:hypothetical protein
MGYGVVVILHGTMGYGDHGALAYGAIQYNHGALRLGAVQKDQIIKFLQIRFILCLSFRKELITVTLTRGREASLFPVPENITSHHRALTPDRSTSGTRIALGNRADGCGGRVAPPLSRRRHLVVGDEDTVMVMGYILEPKAKKQCTGTCPGPLLAPTCITSIQFSGLHYSFIRSVTICLACIP